MEVTDLATVRLAAGIDSVAGTEVVPLVEVAMAASATDPLAMSAAVTV